MKTCTDCGKVLDADEIEFYGNSCNGCERKFSDTMSSQLTRPCKFLEAGGDSVKHRELLIEEFKLGKPVNIPLSEVGWEGNDLHLGPVVLKDAKITSFHSTLGEGEKDEPSAPVQGS